MITTLAWHSAQQIYNTLCSTQNITHIFLFYAPIVYRGEGGGGELWIMFFPPYLIKGTLYKLNQLNKEEKMLHSVSHF